MNRLIISGIIFLVAACSPIEGARRIAGTSIESLREEKKGRFAVDIPGNFLTAYVRVWEILEENGIYIYLSDEDEQYIIGMYFNNIFPRCLDTTEVGFFFAEKSSKETVVEVVSLNRSLAYYASRWLTERLEDPYPEVTPSP